MVSFKSLFVLAAASLLSTATSSPSSRHNGSRHWAADDVTSNLSVDVGAGTEIIIIASNGGGTSSTKYYNSMSMAAGTTHMVTVGGSAGLVYTPNSINAAVGDIVQFNFESKNHTVTQSSFTTPCIKTTGGFDSGFMPNINNTLSPAPMLQFQVTVSTPIWMFCGQTGHCGQGMVFSINPTAAKSQAAFEAAAKAQNGTATAAGTGAGTGAGAAAAASSGLVTLGSGAASSGLVTFGSTATSSVAAVAAATPGSVATGTGTLASGGVCSCSCLCGAADFPAGAGIGAMGGMGGELSMVAAAAKRRSLLDHTV